MDCRDAKCDPLGQLSNPDMCAEVVQYQQHLAVCHHSIEVPHPLQEDDMFHPGPLFAAILTVKVLDIDMAEAARSGVLANDPQGSL